MSDEDTSFIDASEIEVGDRCRFTNGEIAYVKAIEPSRLHKGNYDITFDAMVTGYIDGKRGGERRKEWCYEIDGKFANYKGKGNNIICVYSLEQVNFSSICVTPDAAEQPAPTMQKITVSGKINEDDKGGSCTAYVVNGFDAKQVVEDALRAKTATETNTKLDALLDSQSKQENAVYASNLIFNSIERYYKNSDVPFDAILGKALRLFSLAAGKVSKQKGVNDLIELADADNDYDFWYPVKFKGEPWKPMRSMVGICTPYRFKSQESCMKAIAKVGNETLNKIYGVK